MAAEPETRVLVSHYLVEPNSEVVKSATFGAVKWSFEKDGNVLNVIGKSSRN